MDDDTAGPARLPPGDDLGRSVVFEQVGLTVQLTADRGLAFLDVRSELDRTQALLLPATHRPVISGVSLFTRLGRLHARYWALAYGFGPPGADMSVEFHATAPRYRRCSAAAPRTLAAGCWVAATEGTFDIAALLVDGIETVRVGLADRW